MLKEVIEDALARGEKLKKDIVGQILKSATLNELVNNKRFAETIARVIQTKDEIANALHRNIQDVLKVMKIPSKHDIAAYERRVQKLERELNSLGRRVMKKKLNGSRSSNSKKR